MAIKSLTLTTLIVTYVCSFVALVFIFIRFLCRRMRGERFMLFHDDVWMGVSLVPLLLRLGLSHAVIVNGTSTTKITHALSNDAVERRVLGSKLVLVTRVLYPAFLWCMKACILSFLNRLMSAEPKYAKSIHIIGLLLMLSFIAVVLSTFLECHPFELYFEIPAAQCAQAFSQLKIMGILNIITDLFLIALPLPVIFKSRLPLLRKLQLLLLFAVSSAVIIVTVVRIPLIVVSHSVQDSRTLWASIEILTACVVANAPILNNFYYEWKNRRHNGRDAGVMDEEDRDDELRSGYSSKSKVPNVLMKRPPTRDAMKGMGKGYPRHTSEESFSPPAGGPGPFVIEATTSVTQSISHASFDNECKPSSRYYKGDFLGTQVWANQVFPGPKNPAQRVDGYGINFNQDRGKMSNYNFPDAPGLGVLPCPPPPSRSFLGVISNKKCAQRVRSAYGGGCRGDSQSSTSGVILKSFTRRESATTASEEELGKGSGSSVISRAEEDVPGTPGGELDITSKLMLTVGSMGLS